MRLLCSNARPLADLVSSEGEYDNKLEKIGHAELCSNHFSDNASRRSQHGQRGGTHPHSPDVGSPVGPGSPKIAAALDVEMADGTA